MSEKLQLEAGQGVLDLGYGWGGLPAMRLRFSELRFWQSPYRCKISSMPWIFRLIYLYGPCLLTIGRPNDATFSGLQGPSD